MQPRTSEAEYVHVVRGVEEAAEEYESSATQALAPLFYNGAIITGGASGLGAATTRRLAADGATVVILDLNEAQGQALADELGNVIAAEIGV